MNGKIKLKRDSKLAKLIFGITLKQIRTKPNKPIQKYIQQETRERVLKRIKKITALIQAQFKSKGYQHIVFTIDKLQKTKMEERILNAIKDKTMPNNVKTEEECYTKTRMWWHRDKSKYLGPYLFNILIFELLLPVKI